MTGLFFVALVALVAYIWLSIIWQLKYKVTPAITIMLLLAAIISFLFNAKELTHYLFYGVFFFFAANVAILLVDYLKGFNGSSDEDTR